MGNKYNAKLHLLHLHLFQLLLCALQSEAHVFLHPLCIQTPLVKGIHRPELWLGPAVLIDLEPKGFYHCAIKHYQNSGV